MIVEISDIQFKNGTSEWNVKGKVKRSYVNFELPVGIPIPPVSAKILLDDFECQITVSHYHPTPRSNSSTVFQGNTFYENDRWGRSYVTTVQAKFEHQPPIDLYSSYNDEIFEKSLKAVNRLLRVVRYITNKFVIHNVIPADIDWHKTKLFDENDKELVGRGVIVGSPGGLKTVVGGFTISDQQKTEFIDFLEKNRKIPLPQVLLQNAEDYLFLQNYRASIIECESAFEVCVQKIIYDGFINDGDNQSNAESKISQTPFANLLQHHLDRYLNIPFYNSAEYCNWRDKCYEKRNKLVHEGKTPLENEVSEAILHSKKAIEFLEVNKK